MKANKFKVIGIFIAVIMLLIGGVVYYASTKLNPDEIRKIAINQTQKVFPQAVVTLDRVDIGWGLNFKIQLQKFALNTKDSSGSPVEMLAVDELVVKVPIWAILTNGGVIEIQLDKPLMNYAEFATGNNWTHALAKDGVKQQEVNEEQTGESNQPAVGLFAKSKINVKVSDVKVAYNLRDNSSGQIVISRFLIKGLNFETSTAFEIASDAKFTLADKSVVSFSTIAIGEVNIADLVKNGSVSSLVLVKVNNISKTGVEWKFPEITTDLNVLLKKDGEISGKIQTSFESQNKVTAHFKMTKAIEVSDINVDIFLKDVGAIMGLDRSVDLSKAKLSAKGNLLYTEDKKIDAKLGFSITPGIGYSKDGIVATMGLEGSYKEKDLSVKVKTELLNGLIETWINGEYDLNQKFDLGNLKPFDIKVVATRLKIPEKLIQEKLWEKKDPAVMMSEEQALEKVKQEVQKDGKIAPAPFLIPPVNVNISWSSISIGGEDFSGRGKIITSSEAVAIDDLTFKFSKGSGKLTQTMRLGKKSNESVFDFGITDLNLSSFKPFLPPFVENFSGTFSGKINGSATMFKVNKTPRFDVNVSLDAKKGEIKKLNISEYVGPLVSSIPIVKDQVKDKQVKIDGNFEVFSMKGRFTPETYNLSSFNFIGINKKVEINGAGVIYPMPGSSKISSMDVNLTENGKVGEILQKNLGSKILPMRLSGKGFAMTPEVQFTISRVAKGAAKTKGSEAVQKVLEKNLDKIVPEKAKEQVKGLLDGLFKKK